MAKKKANSLDFSAVCQEILDEYGTEATATLKEVISEAADHAVALISSNSRKRTGAYARDWDKMQNLASVSGASYTVYNVAHYRVAHLLEKDHVFKDANGKVIGQWKGDGVIADAQEKTEAWLESEVRRRL